MLVVRGMRSLLNRLGRSLFDLTVRRMEKGEGARELYISFSKTKYPADIFLSNALASPTPPLCYLSVSCLSLSLFPRTQTHQTHS